MEQQTVIRQFSSSLIHYDSKVHVIITRASPATSIPDVSNCFSVFYSESLNGSPLCFPGDILHRV